MHRSNQRQAIAARLARLLLFRREDLKDHTMRKLNSRYALRSAEPMQFLTFLTLAPGSKRNVT
jgi:hypothetical protein